MSNGTDANSTEKRRGRPKKLETDLMGNPVVSSVDDTKDTVATFLDKILIAKQHAIPGEIPMVETSQEIFDHYMRGQKTPYFFFQDVKVFVKGTVDEIEAKESMTTNELLFPKG